MGSVMRAFDTQLQRVVALKVLHRELTSHPTARRRMEQEARALARLDSPHVIKVHNVFEEGGLLVLDLEFVAGGTLDGRIPTTGVPVEQACGWLRQILSGLAALHAAGLVHRDLKPANVLVTNAGALKITDLGVSHDAQAKDRTRHGARLGTPEYMAPEQIQGTAVDARTDIYAVGVLAYQVLCGRLPFEGTEFDVLAAHIRQPPDVERLRGKAPGKLLSWVMQALAKDPQRRHSSAIGMVAALDAAMGRESHASAENVASVVVAPRQAEPPRTGSPRQAASPVAGSGRPPSNTLPGISTGIRASERDIAAAPRSPPPRGPPPSTPPPAAAAAAPRMPSPEPARNRPTPPEDLATLRPRASPNMVLGLVIAGAVAALSTTAWLAVRHFATSEASAGDAEVAVPNRVTARRAAPSGNSDEPHEPAPAAFVPSATNCQWTASRGASWLGVGEAIDYPLLGGGHAFTRARAKRGGEGVQSTLTFHMGGGRTEVVTVNNADLLVAKAWAPSAQDEWVVGLWAGWARSLTVTTTRLRGVDVATHKAQLDRPEVPDIMRDLYLWIDHAPDLSADGCVLRLGYDPTGQNRGKRPVHSTYFSLPASGAPAVLSRGEWTAAEHPLYDE
ncbi:MAG: serine/threonine protein kinase [Myxococcales bacterium]|nr:serine/threonine protein kinase [Myxococcales bacterium]